MNFCFFLAVLLIVLKDGLAQRGPFPMQSFPGPCPKIEADSNFDIIKMTEGAWYQIYASDQVHWNESLKCVERRYSYTEGNPQVGIQKYYIRDRHPIWTESSIIKTDKNGIFLHGTPAGSEGGNSTPWYHRVEIIALASDPASYCLMWGCLFNEKENTHYESGGISSKLRSLSQEKFDELKTLLKNAGAGIQFEAIDWSDCRARCE